MPRIRLVVIAAAATLLTAIAGQGLAAAGGTSGGTAPAGVASRSVAGSFLNRGQADAAAMSAAMLAAASPAGAGQRLMAAELAAIEPTGAPPGSLSGLDSDCNIEEEGGSSSGVSTSPDASAASTRTVLTELVPAGDLDGKGGPDVLDYRLGEQHQTISAGVTARSGRTGAVLWSQSVAGVKHDFALPYPDADRVGPKDLPGVLLIKQSEPFGGGAVSLTVTALNGAGNQLWTRTMTGDVTVKGDTETFTNVPILIGDIHDVRRPGHDLLVDVLNATLKESGAETGTDQPTVMSAKTGSVVDRGHPATSNGAIPEVVAVPDLDRDRLDDLAVIDPGTNGRIIAEQGNTGAVIWRSVGVPVGENAEITAVGFVTNAHTPDLAVDNNTFAPDSTESLVNGRNGRLVWTFPATCAFKLGKAGPALRPAVGLVTGVTESDGSKSSRVAMTLAPRDARGDLVYRRSVSAKVSVHESADSTEFSIDLEPFGDVQPDGSQDLMVALRTTIGTHTVARRGILSGRDGHLIKEPTGFPTDGSLHRGRGVDLVKPRTDPAGVEVSGYDAATGKKYFQRHIARTTGLHAQLAYGIRVTGHGCSDVVINALGKQRVLFGLFDGNGRPLWTVTASSSRLAGGTVHAGKTPAHFCAA